jgi:RNA polymerase II-associated protein 2
MDQEAPPKVPPKSILRTSTPSLHAPSSASTIAPSLSRQQPPSLNLQQQEQPQSQPYSKASPEPHHLAIALHHAHRIQAQKDAEALILNRILELVTLPSSPSADPASPSATDVAALRAALAPFQSSDYDNLILERNIEGRCGYALCPREHRREDHKGNFRILWGPKSSGSGGRGREMKIVPREKLEMWCSDSCAKRAMYVRVQLAEDPVWERRADDGRAKEISLLKEPRSLKGTNTTTRKMDDQVVKGGEDSTSRSEYAGDQSASATATTTLPLRGIKMSFKDLALERGDSNSAFRDGRVDVQVKEREISHDAAVAAPMPGPEYRHGGSIEGYTPKGQSSPRGDGSD